MPSGSDKLGLRSDGVAGYNWNSKDTKAIIEKLTAIADIDQNQIYLAGFSAGGNMVYAIGIDSPYIFAGGIIFSGMMQKELFTEQKTKEASKKIPFFIVHGTLDQMMPLTLGKEARDYFEKHGFRVKLKEFQGNHTLPSNLLEIMKEAIDGFKEKPK